MTGTTLETANFVFENNQKSFVTTDLAVVELFNQKFPNIRVKHQQLPQLMVSLMSALSQMRNQLFSDSTNCGAVSSLIKGATNQKSIVTCCRCKNCREKRNWSSFGS